MLSTPGLPHCLPDCPGSLAWVPPAVVCVLWGAASPSHWKDLAHPASLSFPQDPPAAFCPTLWACGGCCGAPAVGAWQGRPPLAHSGAGSLWAISRRPWGPLLASLFSTGTWGLHTAVTLSCELCPPVLGVHTPPLGSVFFFPPAAPPVAGLESAPGPRSQLLTPSPSSISKVILSRRLWGTLARTATVGI